MQLYSNNRLRASSLILALVNLLSLAAAARSRGLVSYLSDTPNLTTWYSWEPNCMTTGNCMKSVLLAGACCMSNFQSQSVLSASNWLLNHYFIDNLKSATLSGSQQLFNNLNSWYGMGYITNSSTGDFVTAYTCQVYEFPECLTPMAKFSVDAPIVSPTIASQAASIRCGNWYTDPKIDTDHMLIIGKIRHCNNNWLGGNCLTVYPYLSRCCKFPFDYTNFHMFCSWKAKKPHIR